MTAIRWIFLCAVFVLSNAAWADPVPPSHYCTKPRMPIGGFTDDWQVSQFKSRVREYKNCIEEFVDEQESAIRYHREAANEAIEEFNDFVNYELRR